MIDFISFCVLVAIALVLGRTTGKKAGAGITQMFIKGRPMFSRKSIGLSQYKTWNGNPVRKLKVVDESRKVIIGSDNPELYPVFKGTVSPRAIRNYLKREKLPAVLITAKQVS